MSSYRNFAIMVSFAAFLFWMPAAGQTFDVEGYHRRQLIETYERQAKDCHYEAVRARVLASGRADPQDLANFAFKMCALAIRPVIDSWSLPTLEARTNAYNHWIWPTFRASLVSLGLANGLPYEWPDAGGPELSESDRRKYDELMAAKSNLAACFLKNRVELHGPERTIKNLIKLWIKACGGNFSELWGGPPAEMFGKVYTDEEKIDFAVPIAEQVAHCRYREPKWPHGEDDIVDCGHP
jgi:hypothetical protein